MGHQRGVAALEAVGEHDRQRAARPVRVARRVEELLQRRADAGAAVGVLDDARDVRQRGVDVALAQRLGDPRQARAEGERLALRGPGEAQIVGHLRAQRAGHVDQHQQRARAVRAVAAGEVGDLAGAGRRAQRAAQVDVRPAARGAAPARADRGEMLAQRLAQVGEVGGGRVVARGGCAARGRSRPCPCPRRSAAAAARRFRRRRAGPRTRPPRAARRVAGAPLNQVANSASNAGTSSSRVTSVTRASQYSRVRSGSGSSRSAVRKSIRFSGIGAHSARNPSTGFKARAPRRATARPPCPPAP